LLSKTYKDLIKTNSKMVWYGLAIGAVIGGGLGDDEAPAVDLGDNGVGGAKNVNNDKRSKNGGQGLFSLWGHEVWLYLGGMAGIGEKFGLYGTTGPMIGRNPDWAIGGGVHFAKAVGVGVVIPIRQALQSYGKHQEKVTAALGTGREYLESAQFHTGELISQGGLEQVMGMFS